jgi:putative tryptophan/tyrosine transport system substrate-binding protein
MHAARRKYLLTALGLALASKRAWGAGNTRVGVLFAAGLEPYYDTFRKELRALGYIEGANLTLITRWAEGKLERLPALAAELVSLKPDVLVSSSTPSTAALKKVTASIPIVMATSADPVASGFVASLAHPGRNITGNAAMNFPLSGKTIQMLHSIAPSANRIGLLLTQGSAYDKQLPEVQAEARGFGVTVVPLRANTELEIERAFAIIQKDGIGGLAVFGDSVFLTHRRKIAAMALSARIPAIYQWRSHVEAGGLMSYGPTIDGFWRLAAGYVDRLLKGANPALLPVQQPTVFELVVNSQTATILGLAAKNELLLRADVVIE